MGDEAGARGGGGACLARLASLVLGAGDGVWLRFRALRGGVERAPSCCFFVWLGESESAAGRLVVFIRQL